MNKKSNSAPVLLNIFLVLLALFLVPKTIFAQTDSVVKVKIPTVVLQEKKPADFVQLPAQNMPTVIDQNSGFRRKHAKKVLLKTSTSKSVDKASPAKDTPVKKVINTPNKKLKASLKPRANSYVLQNDSTKKAQIGARPNADNKMVMLFVWIGSALVIAGIVLGLTFNKYAFFASLAGLILILSGILIS